MGRKEQFGFVHDSAGELWDCRWWEFEDHPMPKTTRVDLRKDVTDDFTHYYDAPFPPDRFKPAMINGKFSPKPKRR